MIFVLQVVTWAWKSTLRKSVWCSAAAADIISVILNNFLRTHQSSQSKE